MWAYIPMFRLFALVVGLRDAFQPLGPTLLQPLVDFPRLLAAFPVDVIRIVGPLLVVLPPGGDALVYGVGVIPAAALGQLRLPVQDIDAVVVGGVLLGGVVADGPAVGSIVTQGEC